MDKDGSQRGIALLATLLAITLMIVLVVDFTYSAAGGYFASANQMNELKADYLARSGVQVGMALLAQDARRDARTQEPNDNLSDLWAVPFPAVAVEGGSAGVVIVDEERKLNINQLIDPATGAVNNEFAQTLARLFVQIGIEPQVIQAIVDWLDRDSVSSAGGAEADYYLGLMPPYEPRNGPMPTIGDLRLIRGVDDAAFARLRRFLTIAPDNKVNVNTAPPEVLLATLPDASGDTSMVKRIIAAREQQPFKTILDLNGISGLSAVSAKSASLFTTRSVYFTITGLGSFAGARKLVYATVRRNGEQFALGGWREE